MLYSPAEAELPSYKRMCQDSVLFSGGDSQHVHVGHCSALVQRLAQLARLCARAGAARSLLARGLRDSF